MLRQVVRELRGLLGDADGGALSLGAREIRLRRDAIDVDVWTVMHAAEAGEVHPLLLERQQLPEQLLAGLDDLDPAFRAWVIAKRHALRDRLLRSLERAMTNGPPPQAEVRLAEAILNLDPTHEDARRRLMRARVAAGDTAGALRIYKALWDLLDEDYGMEPSTATQELVAQIKLGVLEPAPLMQRSSPASAPGGARRQDTRLMLSMQPVTVQAVDPETSHLVLGFRMHLIASLVRFREWQVTDAPFPPAASAAQAADGRYELQLTSHQGAHAVHMTIMLKELHTSHYVWSDSFELTLRNWFEAQRRVVQRVAMALNVHVSAERLWRFSEVPDVSLGAYDRWLRCQDLVRTFEAEYLDRAERQFNEIIRDTPNFALPIADWRISPTSSTSRVRGCSARASASCGRSRWRNAASSSTRRTRGHTAAWRGRTRWPSNTRRRRCISSWHAS